tara:strand:+ start:836 stop:1027 length:192 start_codon:yes stop_codon:yes gene_type:complete
MYEGQELNITSAKYFNGIIGEKESIKATIDGQVMYVPLDEDNTHYREIMRQVDAGTLTIAAAD